MSNLPVELNADGVHSIAAPPQFTTTRSFAIELENLGQSTHVHLHLDDDLNRVASIEAGNHFVENESFRRVLVSTKPVEEAVTGKLKVVTGYGSGVTYVDVTVEPEPAHEPGRVIVDEQLAKPPAQPPEPRLVGQFESVLSRLVDSGGFPAFAFAVVAAFIAVAIAIAVDSIVVSLGIAIVLIVTVVAALAAVW